MRLYQIYVVWYLILLRQLLEVGCPGSTLRLLLSYVCLTIFYHFPSLLFRFLTFFSSFEFHLTFSVENPLTTRRIPQRVLISLILSVLWTSSSVRRITYIEELITFYIAIANCTISLKDIVARWPICSAAVIGYYLSRLATVYLLAAVNTQRAATTLRFAISMQITYSGKATVPTSWLCGIFITPFRLEEMKMISPEHQGHYACATRHRLAARLSWQLKRWGCSWAGKCGWPLRNARGYLQKLFRVSFSTYRRLQKNSPSASLTRT